MCSPRSAAAAEAQLQLALQLSASEAPATPNRPSALCPPANKAIRSEFDKLYARLCRKQGLQPCSKQQLRQIEDISMLHSFPADLVVTILSYFDTSGLSTFSLVSKTMATRSKEAVKQVLATQYGQKHKQKQKSKLSQSSLSLLALLERERKSTWNRHGGGVGHVERSIQAMLGNGNDHPAPGYRRSSKALLSRLEAGDLLVMDLTGNRLHLDMALVEAVKTRGKKAKNSNGKNNEVFMTILTHPHRPIVRIMAHSQQLQKHTLLILTIEERVSHKFHTKLQLPIIMRRNNLYSSI